MEPQNRKINRRDFIVKSVMAGTGISLVTNALWATGSSFFNKETTFNNSKNDDMNNILDSSLGKRRLGSLEVTELGFGCMNIAWAYGNGPGKEDSIKLIRKAYEEGIRFFDTAEIYGPHISEQYTGEALKPYRNDVIIATKIGFDIDFETGQLKGGLNSKPKHIKQAADYMLKR